MPSARPFGACATMLPLLSTDTLPVADALTSPCLTDAARERLTALADGHRLRLSPAAAHTDGFFAALFERTG